MYWLFTLVVLLLFVGVAWMVGAKAKAAGHMRERQLWIGIARDISHQYATPLSALMGWVDVIPSMKNLDAALPEMNRDLDRLKLIGDRLGQVGEPSKFERLALRQIIADLRTYFEKKLPSGERGVEISVEISGEPQVRANRELLQWALEHLVRNAVDSLAGGSGRIILRASSEAKGVIMEVEDTGQGIAPRLQRKIFLPGFSTKMGGRGTGLALARFIIEENHGGKLSLQQSRRGAGTTFRITLPSAAEV